MKKEEVPQDNSRTYSGHKKVIYATNNDGAYEKVKSSGWETEEFVTLMAVSNLQSFAVEAYKRAITGKSATLEFHMYNNRLDIVGLSQATGFFKWQIKRHLNPKTFSKLSNTKLEKYCDALGLTIIELQTLPDHAPSYDK